MFQISKEDFYFCKDIDYINNKPSVKPHYHVLFEIYFLLDGECTYFIDNKTYQVHAGDLVLIPRDTIHRTQYPLNIKYSRMLINCSDYFIPESVYKEMDNLLYIYRNNEISDKIFEILSEIKKDYYSPDQYSIDFIQGLMNNLFILIARYPNEISNTSAKNEYIENAVNYIRNNFSSRITLNDVAEVCAITPEHLSRIFKKETGFGFVEYLTFIRLQHAEYLIKTKKMSITEVSHRCGFEDSNYFSYTFKKKYGISPREMKKQERLNPHLLINYDS